MLSRSAADLVAFEPLVSLSAVERRAALCRDAVERRALPWSTAPRSAVVTALSALAILMLGWFALRPTSQTVQAFNAQAFNAQGLATVQAFSVTVQAFNAQGLANTCRSSTRSARSFW